MVENEFRVIQDGVPVAWATSEREILHYAAIYEQDGPVSIQARPERGRWKPFPHAQSGIIEG